MIHDDDFAAAGDEARAEAKVTPKPKAPNFQIWDLHGHRANNEDYDSEEKAKLAALGLRHELQVPLQVKRTA